MVLLPSVKQPSLINNMSLLSRILDKVSVVFHKAESKFPAVLKASMDYLASFDLTPEHIARVKDEVVAVEKAFGGSINGFAKAAKVATAIQNLGGELKLPEGTQGFIGGIVSAAHSLVLIQEMISAKKK